MKKNIRYLLVLLIIGVFALTGCSNTKKALSASEVQKRVEEIGFNVNKNEEKIATYDYISNVLTLGNKNFFVEFVEIVDSEYAKEIFNDNKENIDGNRKGNFTNKSITGENYESYELISDGYYMYICRVDNTILYVNQKIEYQNEIKQIINTLKY